MDQKNQNKDNHSARHEWSQWKGKKNNKQKNAMRLVSAILFFVALLIILVFVRGRANTYKENEAKRDTLLGITADQIIAIEMSSDKGRVSYVRDDGAWRSALGKVNQPVDSESSSTGDSEESGEDISFSETQGDGSESSPSEEELEKEAAGKLAASVTGVRLYQILNGVTDLKQYGLEEPRAIIKVTDKEGTITEIAIGDDNDTTSTVYCYLNGNKSTVYAVSTSLTASLQ